MDNETKDTLKKVAEYTAEENNRLRKKMLDMMRGSAILILFNFILMKSDTLNALIPASSCENLAAFTMGATLAVLGLNILYLSGRFERISQWKENLFRKDR